MSLISKLLLGLATVPILIGTVFFAAAGSLKFWQGWIFLGIVSVILIPGSFVLFIPFFVLRLLNEEKLLRQELPGYTEHCLKTRFRLVPFVW